MLRLTVPPIELWDSVREEFIYTKEHTLQLEHSLVSVSKWESKWCKPFLGKEGKTREETLDYIKCMTLTQNVDPMVYNYLRDEQFKQVKDYINASMTATWFREEKNVRPNREQVTSELIYYWMVAYNIPFECQKWHLNRLLTLIRICNVKNQQPKKTPKKDMLRERSALNKARRQQLGSKG